MGYRINFETWQITETGGIYVRTFPSADQIIFDSKIYKKPGIFNNAVFVQDLLPKQHSVLIKKEGYFDYQKTLPVVEKEVSKIENIILFKKDIAFSELLNNSESFSFSPDKKHALVELSNTNSLDFAYFEVSNVQNQKTYSLPLKYTSVVEIIWSQDSKKALIKTENLQGVAFYILDFTKETQQKTALSYLDAGSKEISFNPRNSDEIFFIKNNSLFLFKDKKLTTIVKELIDYKFLNNNVVWLSTEGKLNQSDTLGKTTEVLADWPVNKNYLSPQGSKIEIISEKINILTQGYVYEYSFAEKSLKESTLGMEIDNFKVLTSPDNKNIVYYNNSKIYLYIPTDFNGKIGDVTLNSVLLFESNYPEIITDCYWINNDYIIFQSGNKIIASEIDFRGNINAVEIPQTYPASPESKTPKFIFNSHDSKIYILTYKMLYSSEKILP